MVRPCVTLLFVLLMTVFIPNASAAAGVVLLHPVDGTVTDEEWGAVTGFWDQPGKEEVTVLLNGEAHRVPLWDGVFQRDLDWAEGENELQVEDQVVRFISDAYADAFRKPAVHQAMLDNCGNCHVLGSDLDLSRTADDTALCAGCHGEVTGAVKHGTGTCTGCHDPHLSWNAGLLRRIGNKLCLGCHADRAGKPGVAHYDVWQKLECSACHGGHRPTLDGVGDRCATCHQGSAAADAGHRDAMDTGCQICHTMHGRAGEGLWKDPAVSCRTCHPAGGDQEHDGAAADCGTCHGVHEDKEMPPSGERCQPCHADMTEKERLHGPDAVGRCEVCHLVHDIANRSPAVFSCTGCHGTENLQGGHTGSVVGFDTCLQCHHLHQSEEAFFLAAFQHAPFKERSCTDCHDQPGYDTRRKLTAPWAPLCLECHPDVTGDQARHGPVAEGRCQACHDPHASQWPAHLRQELRALCLSCHPETAEKLESGGPHQERQTCSDCHDPHGGPHEKYLLTEGNSMCTGCHIDPVLDLGGVLKPYVHGPLNSVGCVFCHDPHASPGGPHLRMTTQELCVACHEEFEASSLSARGLEIHRPVLEGKCADCHRSHAAQNKGLLLRTDNALCRKCHDPARHSHTLTAKADSSFASVPEEFPREGDQMSCTGCHLPHTSTERRLYTRPRAELCQSCHQGI